MKNLLFSLMIILFVNVNIKAQTLTPETYSGIPEASKTKVFSDDFSDNNTKWPEKSDTTAIYKVADGFYYIDIVGSTGKTIAETLSAFDDTKNYEVETKMQFLQGVKDKEYDLMFGGDEKQNNYRVGLTGDGGYYFYKKDNGEKKVIEAYTITSTVKKTEMNKITIRKYDGKFYLFINETLLYQSEAGALFGKRFGFLVMPKISIKVDEIRISYINSPIVNKPFVKPVGRPINLLAICENGKWGYMDSTGKTVVPCKFDGVYTYGTIDFTSGMVPVKVDKKWGYADAMGNLLIAAQYSDADEYKNGLAHVEESDDEYSFTGGKVSYLDETGKNIVADADYELITGLFGAAYFSDGLLRVKKDGKYGFIDKTGKIIIRCTFNYAEDFHEGYAVGKMGEKDKYGYINKKGLWAIQPQYTQANKFYDGIAIVTIEGGKKYSFIDKTGKITGSTDLDLSTSSLFSSYSLSFSGGYVEFKQNDKRGLIDKTGKIIAPAIYDDINPFYDGLAAVCKGGTKTSTWGIDIWTDGWGFVDVTGKMVIPNNYETVSSFSNSVAPVKENGLWGLMNKTGNWIVKPTYKERPETYGKTLIRMNGENYYHGDFTYIDKTGKTIWAPKTQ